MYTCKHKRRLVRSAGCMPVSVSCVRRPMPSHNKEARQTLSSENRASRQPESPQAQQVSRWSLSVPCGRHSATKCPENGDSSRPTTPDNRRTCTYTRMKNRERKLGVKTEPECKETSWTGVNRRQETQAPGKQDRPPGGLKQNTQFHNTPWQSPPLPLLQGEQGERGRPQRAETRLRTQCFSLPTR